MLKGANVGFTPAAAYRRSAADCGQRAERQSGKGVVRSLQPTSKACADRACAANSRSEITSSAESSCAEPALYSTAARSRQEHLAGSGRRLNAARVIDLDWDPPFEFVPEGPIRVGYADLQMGERHFKDSMLEYAPDDETEEYEDFVERSERVFRIDKLPRHEEDGEGLRQLSEIISEQKIKLLFIDSLEEVKPVESRGRSAQQLDAGIMQPITHLAHTHPMKPHICVIYQRNKRKDVGDSPIESLAATNALPAAADDIISIVNPREDDHPHRRILQLEGRNVRNGKYVIELTENSYKFVGDVAEVIKGSVERGILRVMKRSPNFGFKPVAIAEATGKRRDDVRRALANLLRKELVYCDKHGMYSYGRPKSREDEK